ncbi:hypothetical protein K435DRAFT_563150, partial [Dendrothele bispora CBS 962.96]
IYKHKDLHVNYTSYDLCQEQDSINPRTQPNIMMLAGDVNDNDHPYWYGHIV